MASEKKPQFTQVETCTTD